MDSDQRLIDAAMQNFIGSGRKLVAHIDGADDRFCGRVYAFRTGIPISIFNGVIVDWSPVTSDVEGALDWVDEWDVPYLLYLPEPLVDDLAPVTTRRELRLGAWQVPHMALAPVDPPQFPEVWIEGGTIRCRSFLSGSSRSARGRCSPSASIRPPARFNPGSVIRSSAAGIV